MHWPFLCIVCLVVQDLGIFIVAFLTPEFELDTVAYFSIDRHGRDTGISKRTPVDGSCLFSGDPARSEDSGSTALFGGHRCHGRSPCVGRWDNTKRLRSYGSVSLLALPDLYVLWQSLATMPQHAYSVYGPTSPWAIMCLSIPLDCYRLGRIDHWIIITFGVVSASQFTVILYLD